MVVFDDNNRQRDDALEWSTQRLKFISEITWEVIHEKAKKDLGEEEWAKLQKLLSHVSKHCNKMVQFIVSTMSSATYCEDILRDMRSLVAYRRYFALEELYQRNPHNVFLVFLLAECHYHLQDSSGCLFLLKRGRDLLGSSDNNAVVDSDLEVAIQHLHVFEQLEAQDNYDDEDDDDDETTGEKLEICKYSRPLEWRKSSLLEPSSTLDLNRIFDVWEELKNKSGDGVEQFTRYVSVTTNELEGVFLLEGDSSKRLARCGLMQNSICGISSKSRQTDPNQIISIMKNTEKCYTMLQDVMSGIQAFDEPFIKKLHRTLLHDNNVDIKTERCDYGLTRTYATISPMGVYRRVPCFAIHQEQGYETRYCPPNDLQTEMDFFFQQVQRVLLLNNNKKDLVDPYRAAAYLQWCFVRIHPFSDGNGRLSRLIASIPLLMCGLPPLVVTLERKDLYFAALKIMDDNEECIDALANFMQNETVRAIKRLLKYEPPPTTTSNKTLSERHYKKYSSRRGRGRRYYLEQQFREEQEAAREDQD